VPNVDATPPQETPPPNVPSLQPGNLQLHFPDDVGNGYLPGSSSDTMDNERAPMVPGMTIKVPLAPPPPAPPPDRSPP
jgi:hypothetical protein